MTRSLGDFYAHQFGLTSKPSTTFNTLDIFNIFDDKNNKYEANEYIITVGSDGVWDCWKWDDFSDYVNGVMSKYKNKLENVCQTVLKHTIQRAKACFGEGSYDDASLVCVALRPQLFYPDKFKQEQPSQSQSNNQSNQPSINGHTNGTNGHSSNNSYTSNGHNNNNNNDTQNITSLDDDDNDEKEELSVKGLDEDDD